MVRGLRKPSATTRQRIRICTFSDGKYPRARECAFQTLRQPFLVVAIPSTTMRPVRASAYGMI